MRAYALVTQWKEYLTSNQADGGSSPSGRAMSIQTIEDHTVSDLNSSDMIHITVLGNPKRAICGAHLRGILLSHEASIDCIVCYWIKNGNE